MDTLLSPEARAFIVACNRAGPERRRNRRASDAAATREILDKMVIQNSEEGGGE